MAKVGSFWSISSADIIKQLDSSPLGLSSAIAKNKLLSQEKELRQKSQLEKDVILFLSQFKNPLVLLLIIAVILSGFLGETSDVFIIMSILLLTGTLSFIQERNAGRAVEKLRELLQVSACVLRDGKEQSVPVSEVVQGDVIILKAGDIIPADCLLIESNDLHVNEAVLTGESFPADKELGVLDASLTINKITNSVWQGSSVASGKAKALAVNTGKDAMINELTANIQKDEETAFEKGLKRFGFFLLEITVALSIFILIINIYFGKPVFDSVLFALALTVGMAPELLPAIMTIAMSNGAKKMAEKKVIVRKLSAIQNLGEVNLLCTDKTGTITEGVINVSGAVDISGKENEKVKRFAFFNAALESGYANPIDDAIRQLKVMDISTVKKLDEIPYDFIRKRLSIALNDGTQNIMITKGALDNITAVCAKAETADNTYITMDVAAPQIDALYKSLSAKGIRTIGLCYKVLGSSTLIKKEDEKDMIFLGLLLLEDPLKAGVKDAIDKLAGAGVGLKIITGDNIHVAAYIGEQLGIKDCQMISGSEMLKMSTEALNARSGKIDVFAEVEPYQKERIIKSLQAGGFTVAYMGDGINDVSALHAADAGISVSDAVDVAKEAADIVLLEKNLMVLYDGIRLGRYSFTNSLKYIFINTSATFGNMFSVAAASILLPFIPMLPKQILLTNFITDFPYLSVASDNVDEEQLAAPSKWNLKQLRIFMVVFGIHSSIFDFITFGSLYMILQVNNKLSLASQTTFRTGWFLESVLTEIFILFVIRSRKPMLKSVPGKYLIILNLIAAVITLILPYSPFNTYFGLDALTLKMLSMVLAIVFAYGITADILKGIFFKYSKA